MSNNYLVLQIKLLKELYSETDNLDKLELSNIILNDLLKLINKYNIYYELNEYIEYEYIKNIQKEINCIYLKINNIFLKNELEEVLDLLIKTYSSNKFKYLLYIYDNNKMSSIRINKKGKKIYTKNQKKFTVIRLI